MIQCPACNKNLNYNIKTAVWKCKNNKCKHFNRRQFGGKVNKGTSIEEE